MKGLTPLVLMAGMAFASTAAAEPVWQSAIVVAPDYRAAKDFKGLTEEAQLFAGRDGEAVIVWTGTGICTGVDACSKPILSVSRKDAGSVWSAPTELTRFGYRVLSVGGNGVGEVAVAWWSGYDLLVRRKSSGSQAWSPAVVATSASFLRADDPTVTIGPSGDIALAWDAAAYCGGRCAYDPHVAFVPAGSTHGEDVELGDDHSLYNVTPSVLIDAAGNALAVWPVHPTPGIPSLRSSFRPVGGSWQPSVEIIRGEPDTYLALGPNVAMNAAGDAIAAWSLRGQNGRPGQGTFALFRPAGGSWSQPMPVDAERFERPKVLIAENGDALITWRTSTKLFSSTFRRAALAWSPTVLAAEYKEWDFGSEEGAAESVAMAPNGNAVALWNEGRVLKTAVKPRGSAAWSAPFEVATNYRAGGRLAFDVDGNALALWGAYQQNGDAGDLVVSDLVDHGPVITSFAFPQRLRVRQRMPFRLEAFPWRADLAGAPRWLFGDGGSALGARVSHVYRRAGTYRLTVTVRDVAGGTVSRTARIRVVRGR